jgi:hypothetical protein
VDWTLKNQETRYDAFGCQYIAVSWNSYQLPQSDETRHSTGISQGAGGFKVSVSGRLSGAEMARGLLARRPCPLQDPARGMILPAEASHLRSSGIKVWIYRGLVMGWLKR